MGSVIKRSLCLVSLGVLCFAFGGCASPGPATPSFAAMPGKGKSYEAFQRDDQYCQSSAQQAIGYQSPGEAANQNTVRTAAVGTAIGAVAGAALDRLIRLVSQGDVQHTEGYTEPSATRFKDFFTVEVFQDRRRKRRLERMLVSHVDLAIVVMLYEFNCIDNSDGPDSTWGEQHGESSA